MAADTALDTATTMAIDTTPDDRDTVPDMATDTASDKPLTQP